jgi:hypothetical protein
MAIGRFDGPANRHSSAVDQGVLQTGNPEHTMDDRQTSYGAPDTFGQPDNIQAGVRSPTRSCPTATTTIQVIFIGGRNWTRSPSGSYGQPGSSDQSSSGAGLLLHCWLRNQGGPGPG